MKDHSSYRVKQRLERVGLELERIAKELLAEIQVKKIK